MFWKLKYRLLEDDLRNLEREGFDVERHTRRQAEVRVEDEDRVEEVLQALRAWNPEAEKVRNMFGEHHRVDVKIPLEN